MIEVPSLLIDGIYESASGDTVKPFVDEIPDVTLITIESTTHSPHLEKNEEYMKIVGSFCLRLELYKPTRQAFNSSIQQTRFYYTVIIL